MVQEEGAEEEGVDEVEDEEVCETTEEELELGAMFPIRPVKRPRIGSAQRLLLQVEAGSRVKRPV